jgi:hypothetical protein
MTGLNALVLALLVNVAWIKAGQGAAICKDVPTAALPTTQHQLLRFLGA